MGMQQEAEALVEQFFENLDGRKGFDMGPITNSVRTEWRAQWVAQVVTAMQKVSPPAATQAQPPPTRNDSPEVWPLVIRGLRENEPSPLTDKLIAACEARAAFGAQKYGVALQVDNGRNAAVDLLQEALDAMAYAYQHYLRVRTVFALKLYLSATRLALGVIEELERTQENAAPR